MFGFDPKYAMFDITPVENQFILEYLPAAKGDYVKVYLYGLMRCYHPEEDMNLDRMSHELNMTEDEVKAAFSYWERRRLVHRVSDNPPRWQYVNLNQLNVSGDMDPEPEYTSFSNAIYDAFDKVRRLHGAELNTCFEWHEDLHLPTEVIIMLLNHMVSVKGKNFRIADADKIAAQMAEEDIRTVEDAEEFLTRDEQAYRGIKKILKLLGKKSLPSEAQVELYRKWTRDWGFPPEVIEIAAGKTALGTPSLAYLEGILKGMREEGAMTPEAIRQSAEKSEGFRKILKLLGKGEDNPGNRKLYDEMLALYPQEVIEIAARECGHAGKGVRDTLELLQAWKKKGLETREDVEKYVQSFHDQTDLIRKLKRIWGTDETRTGKADRTLVMKWQNELGLKPEVILAAAAYANDTRKPMEYLDKILADYPGRGITTAEQVRQDHAKHPAGGKANSGRVIPAQDFVQRDYNNVPDEMMQDLADEVRAFMKDNGGESDA